MRWMQIPLVAAAGLAGLAAAVPSLATLDGTNSGASVAAEFEGSFVPGVVETLGDRVNVELSNIATKGVELGPTFAGDFSYSAMVSGSATGLYGGGFGQLSGEASAAPEEVASTEVGQPAAVNTRTSSVDAVIEVAFIETGVVTGGAPGTPVTLEVNFLLDSTSALGGGNPSFMRIVNAQFFGRVIDNSAGFVGVERNYFADNFETLEFDTAVGHELSLEGRFGLLTEGTAGRGNGFVPQFTSAIDAVGSLWIGVPDGISIVAPSGHDYTVAVPEPGGVLLVLAGSAVLVAAKAAPRT